MTSQVNAVTLYQQRFKLQSENPAMKESDFQMPQLNDFTTECIMKERSEYEEGDCLALVGVCPSRHGGMLDYPKIVTESAGLVSHKWELCLLLLSPDFYRCDDTEESQLLHQHDENSPENFYASVFESANKLILHHAWLTEVLVKASDFEKIAGVAGGLALIRNKLWQFNELILTNTGSGMFSGLYVETCDLLESLCQQMTLYYSNTLNTIVIIDSDSQDWEDTKPFHEGERVSYCVQMWWYSMETSRQYLWSSLPPNMSQNIFLSVLSQSVSTLTHRYTNVSPSTARLGQYRADILAILLAVSELLPCVSEDLASLLASRPNNVIIRNIDTKCELLLAALVMVTSPASHLLSSLHSRSPHCSDWRALLCPGHRQTETNKLHMLARLVSHHPQPSWPLIVQLCLSSQSAFPGLLLTHMGAFIPPAVAEVAARCGSVAQCLGPCLGPADSDWSRLVVLGSLLPLISDESATCLAQALAPLLAKLSLPSWECLQATNLWNLRRPVWVSAIVNILDPFLAPAVSDVLHSLDEGITWTLSHISLAKKLLMENVKDLLESLPLSVAGCLLYVRSSTPSSVRPLAQSAVAQLVVSTLYQALHTTVHMLRSHSNPVQKEKLDFLQALAESLCSEELDLQVLDASLESRLDKNQLAELESLPGRLQEPSKEERTEKFEIIAYNVLQQEQNKIALTALHRFLSYNCDWVGWALGLDHLAGVTPRLRPWDSVPAPPPRPHTIIQRIGSIHFDSLMDITLEWEELCAHVLTAQNKPSLCKLLHLRPAFSDTEASYLPQAELQANLEIRDLLLVKK